MSILIGHASIDENGRANGGAAGDQTGKEVCVRSWYQSGWNVALRPKSATVAEKMASACETLCNGNLVGYDQYQRNDLWDELAKVNWDPAALKTKCETDCSAFMTACAKAAGIEVPRVPLGGGKYNAPVTQTMRGAFDATGSFEVLTDSKYLTSDAYLKRGDILLRESGHTAMALGNGVLSGATVSGTAQTPTASSNTKEIKATEAAHYFDKALAGAYKCTASALNIRNGAGTSKKILTTIKSGDTVQCYGYYNTVDGVKWMYVQFKQGSVQYTAFASEKYLSKQ